MLLYNLSITFSWRYKIIKIDMCGGFDNSLGTSACFHKYVHTRLVTHYDVNDSQLKGNV